MSAVEWMPAPEPPLRPHPTDPALLVYPGLRALISGILNGEESDVSERKSTNPKDILSSGEDRVLLHLIPSPALIETARAMMDGARKYGPYNWREEGVGACTYISAAMRHLRSYLDGERDAADSKVHHLGHAMACLAILLDAEAVGNLVDDRPLPAPTASLMDALKDLSTEPLDGLTSENTPDLMQPAMGDPGFPGPYHTGEHAPDKYMAGEYHSTARGVGPTNQAEVDREPLDEYVGRRGAELGLFKPKRAQWVPPRTEAPTIAAEDIHVDDDDFYGVSVTEEINAAADAVKDAMRQAEQELIRARTAEIIRDLRCVRRGVTDPVPPDRSNPGGCC